MGQLRGMFSTPGTDLAAAPFSASIAGSLSLWLMNRLMSVCWMKPPKNFTPYSVTPFFPKAVAASLFDLENLTASIGTDCPSSFMR